MAMTAVQYGIVLVPVLAYGAIRRSRDVCAATGLVLGIGLIQAAILFTPSLGPLAQLKFNWVQKLIAFLCTFAIVSAPRFGKSDCGFGMPNSRWAFPIAFLIGLAYALVDSLGSSDSSGSNFSKAFTESVLFEMTMPGLQEEPLYRGLMLCVFDRAFGRPWKVLGVQFGMGVALTTLLFAVGHLVALDEHWHLIVETNPAAWINFFVFSLFMCWIRYRFKSIWPAVLAHNADNSIAITISHFK